MTCHWPGFVTTVLFFLKSGAAVVVLFDLRAVSSSSRSVLWTTESVVLRDVVYRCCDVDDLLPQGR